MQAAFRAVRRLRGFCRGTLACAAIALSIVPTTVAAAVGASRIDEIGTRVDRVLVRSGLGRDALAVIGNVIQHEGPPQRAAPPIVLELLASPLAATDAPALFERSVPRSLQRLAAIPPGNAPPAGPAHPGNTPINDLLAVYLDELAQAQRALREAVGAVVDSEAIVRQFGRQALPPTPFRGMTPPVNPALVERAGTRFIDATARFAALLRARGASVRFPDQVARFDSPIGTVSIGTRGDDRHGPDAAIIIDPGGNDSYERAPATGGAISVIVDLGGDDRYHGVDVVVHGLSAIVDFSGDDRYVMSGPGIAAAVAGVSIVLDMAGDDAYEARIFGQGAAAYGLGALIDLSGNDTYQLQAAGQGLGMTHGLGLLWDRDGDDTYRVGGVSDAYDRGGGISMAQGAAYGARTWSGGGIGILRDDAGDDVYEAEMFAQGMGYYYGLGLLWDRAGNDRYRAVRYAQGNGVHEAVGVLRDDGGNDRYLLTFGVGQGMGLDLAVGVLLDAAGDDRYESQVVAQGAATANGMGILIDDSGANEWRMAADPRSWGRIGWEGGLPTLGFLLHDPARATFMRENEVVPPPASGMAVLRPQGAVTAARDATAEPGCVKSAPESAEKALPLVPALRAIAPGFAGGSADPAIGADVQRRLTTQLEESLGEVPPDDFNLVWPFTRALRCSLAAATPEEAALMWAAVERSLRGGAALPLALSVITALRMRPPPWPQTVRMLRVFDHHLQCRVRAAALFLRHAAAPKETAGATAETAQAALQSSCWQLQAAGLRALEDLDIRPEPGGRLASFLRDAGEPEAEERERGRAGEGESERK